MLHIPVDVVINILKTCDLYRFSAVTCRRLIWYQCRGLFTYTECLAVHLQRCCIIYGSDRINIMVSGYLYGQSSYIISKWSGLDFSDCVSVSTRQIVTQKSCEDMGKQFGCRCFSIKRERDWNINMRRRDGEIFECFISVSSKCNWSGILKKSIITLALVCFMVDRGYFVICCILIG